LHNSGVGPAIIQDVEVTFDGLPVRRWGDVLDLAPLDTDLDLMFTNADFNGSVLAANTGVEPFYLHLAHDEAPAQREAHQRLIPERYGALFRRLDVRICYCSPLDDCWLLHDRRQTTERVDACPRFPKEFGR